MSAPTPARLSAAELIDLVLDEDSWSSWDVPPSYGDISDAYAAELAAARGKSGVDESVLSGEGLMHGRRVAVVMGEFGFLAGSIGRAAVPRLPAPPHHRRCDGVVGIARSRDRRRARCADRLPRAPGLRGAVRR